MSTISYQLESMSKDDNQTYSRTIHHMRLENLSHLLGQGKQLTVWQVLECSACEKRHFDRILSFRVGKPIKLRDLVWNTSSPPRYL